MANDCGDGKRPGPDPDSFIFPASDDQGHGVKLWVRVPPGLSQQINNVVASKAFPYRNTGELMRHAMHRHLGYLSVISPVPIPSVMGQSDAILELCRQEEYSASFGTTMTQVTAQVNRFMGQGELPEARRFLLKVKGNILRMPQGYWREKYLAEFAHQFGSLLNGKPPKLNPKQAEPDDEVA